MSGNRELTKKNPLSKMMQRSESATVIIFIAMLIIVFIMQNNFFTPSSLRNSILSYTPLILMAMGQAIVILAGGLDLSSGTAMSLMLCVLTSIMKKDDPSTGVIALLAAIGVMLVIGLVNGIAVGVLKLPPIIATFATSYIWLGIALFITPTPGGESVNWMRAFYDFSLVDGMPEALKSFGSVVPTAVLLIIGGALLWYFISRTRTGRYMYAVGSNRETAYQSGIRTGRIQTLAYVLNAVFLLLCALFYAAQNQAGSARIGDPLTLQSVAAAVVGGIALAGGRGNVFMAIIGAVIMSLVSKIIFFADIPSAYQTLVSGVIIIVAIASSAIYTTVSEKAILKGGKQA
jgi:ribose transport system permease protein